MEKKSRRIVLLIAVLLIVIFCAGFWRGCIPDSGRIILDPGGAKRYEAINSNAQDVAGSTEKSIEGSLESMQRARGEITESLSGVGGIRSGIATIEGEFTNSACAVGRIENGIQLIERTLQEAENRADSLALSGKP